MSEAKRPWEETWELLPRDGVWGSDLLSTKDVVGECFASLDHAFVRHLERGQLAAAAPDLYRALEAILIGEDGYCRCCEHTVGGSREHSFNCAGFNALRKARGEGR